MPVLSEAAIVDYGMGNLFSVKHACDKVGLQASITANRQEILKAAVAILPGVGAFGEAMKTLSQLGLDETIKEFAASGKPLIGVCLGMQLLMTESFEFGRHRGLDLISGEVIRLTEAAAGSGRVKVPQIGWNRIHGAGNGMWNGTPLEGLREGEFQYFVHSYYVKPSEPDVVLATTWYGQVEFCSGLRRGNIFACQFHPERSGPQGIAIYRNIAKRLPS